MSRFSGSLVRFPRKSDQSEHRQKHDGIAPDRRHSLKLLVLQARTESELETAFAMLVQKRAEALVVAGDNFLTNQRNQIVELANAKRCPRSIPFAILSRSVG